MTITTNQPRLTVEEFLRQRAESEALFSPPDDGGLNLPALMTLIDWAEADEEVRRRRFAGWGDWRQSAWGVITADDPNIKALAESEDPDAQQHAVELLTDLDRNGVCGTAYCMAGQAVAQAGYELLFEDPYVGVDGIDLGLAVAGAERCVKTEPTGEVDRRGRPIFRPVGDDDQIESVAARILGLSPDEEDLFFNGSNSIDRLKRYVNRFCANRDMEQVPYPDEADFF
jgi:hypothetical protein